MTKNQKADAIKALMEARRAAFFATAMFHKPEHYAYNAEYSDEVKEATRTYRESWVIPPIEHAIRLLEPGVHAQVCDHCGRVH